MDEERSFGDRVEAKVDEYAKRLKDAGEEAQARGREFLEAHKPDLDVAHEKLDLLRYQLTLLKMRSTDAAEDLKSGVENALEEAKGALKALKTRIAGR